MTDSYAMLADPTSDGRRTAVLKSDMSGTQVRATALAADEDLLAVDLWLGGDVAHLGVVFDSQWMFAASTQDHDRQVAMSDLREQLKELGYPLNAGEDRSLLADHVHNGKRTAVLKDDQGIWQLRGKLVITDDEVVFVQLRIWYQELGYMHVVIRDDGVFVASSTGGVDKDAYDRLRGELGRRGIEID